MNPRLAHLALRMLFDAPFKSVGTLLDNLPWSKVGDAASTPRVVWVAHAWVQVLRGAT